MTNVTDLATHQAASRRPSDYNVTFNDKNKLVLPEVPKPEDLPGMCAWLTCVFSLSRAHPITGGTREGLRGPEGHVVLHRADAPAIRFEPATRINTAAKLIETLSWQTQPADGPLHALGNPHCRDITYVVRMLCGAHDTVTENQETIGIIGTFLQNAEPIEGYTTHGTPAQRFEAAVALRCDTDAATGRPTGPSHYLIDDNTGEFVIRVSDLAEAARRHIGSSVPRGWLDGRIQSLGWQRIRLDGHAQPGRAGRQGAHARVTAYRGHLPEADDDIGAVTT
jgi:hypothetical protein